MKPDYDTMAGLTARQRQRLEVERFAGRGRKIVKAVLAHNVGLTRDQLNQVMLELQECGSAAFWSMEMARRLEQTRNTELWQQQFEALCHAGRILARACGIEVKP